MEFVPTDHPVENEYPKLVRDRIPEIIEERTGTSPEQRTAADDREFESFLLRKIVEEAIELQHSAEHDNLEEEVVDINELIRTLLKLRNKKAEEIELIREEKKRKNGGFEKRIIMLSKVKKPE